MDVTSATAAQSASNNSLGALNEDFDQFLMLLVTQLENQDPLEPMDSNEFTNQLVQFSIAEQNVKTNSHLESLLASQTLNLTALGVSFIGKNVEVEGNTFDMDGTHGAFLAYALPQDAASGTVTILDEEGQLVYSQNAELSAGKHEFTWDGIDNNGNPVPPGNYEMRIGALTEDNIALNPITFVPGYVSGLESDQSGNLLLNVGDLLIPITNVSKIFESPAV